MESSEATEKQTSRNWLGDHFWVGKKQVNVSKWGDKGNLFVKGHPLDYSINK